MRHGYHARAYRLVSDGERGHQEPAGHLLTASAVLSAPGCVIAYQDGTAPTPGEQGERPELPAAIAAPRSSLFHGSVYALRSFVRRPMVAQHTQQELGATTMPSAKIARVEWARLEGRRPRLAGNNSRTSVHGIEVHPPIARVTADDGSSGFGWARATPDEAAALLGVPLDDAFSPASGVAEAYLGFEYPIWDLMAKRAGSPTYELAAAASGIEPASLPRPFRVRCYDTSLYIDDLHLESDEEGAALIAKEAREGYERGHRAFKIKVGRGARYMELEAGTRRDVAVIRAVRDAVGPDAPVMIDANNGYNLNLTKRVLRETADCRVFWMEEPFHEDAALYQDLHDWLAREGLATLIADGEGQASPTLMDWARDRVVDVIQYDVLRPGFTRWLGIGRQLDAWGVKAAPHHYGGHYGNYASCHLAAAVNGFLFTEWDEATTTGLDGSAYRIDKGVVTVPRAPGFGLELDDVAFRAAVVRDGFEVGT